MGWVQTKIIETSSVEQIGTLKEHGLPQANTIPLKFSQINHRPLAIMDGCKGFVE